MTVECLGEVGWDRFVAHVPEPSRRPRGRENAYPDGSWHLDDWELECAVALEEFRAAVRSGMFTDDDRHGYYGTETVSSGVPVVLSDIRPPRKALTHVVWYNK